MSEAGFRILVADDEESMRYFVTRGLARSGYRVDAVADGAAAVTSYEQRPYDVAVLDLKMPGLDGIEVLDRLRKHDPEALVVLMTAYGTIQSAVEAMRRGAFDYVTKPLEIDELVLTIERGLEHRRTLRENRELRTLVDHRRTFAGLVGQSRAMRRVFRQIELVQQSDATVLIAGESGTGKELVARAVHIGSPRAKGPFVAVNCSALPDTLVENELFGHEPGAFTGAIDRKAGLVMRADGGTLFLDEIAETSTAVQAKLERFLAERRFTPLGGDTPVEVDVRVVAASHRDLRARVAAGTLREELFWRLNVVTIDLPPLRERREDVPALVDHYLAHFAARSGAPVKTLTVDAMIVLTNYAWPGNVRELQNTVERMVVLNADKTELDVHDLPEEVLGGSRTRREQVLRAGSLTWEEAITGFERDYLTDLFRRTRGNISEAARIAAISRGHLHRKVKQLGIDPEEFR